MEVKIVHEASVVYEFLKNKIRYNYIYQFNNLVPKEWKNVICYGLYEGSELKEIATLLIKYDIPVLLATSFENEKYNTELIRRIKRFLPSEFYTHIDKVTLENIFNESDISEMEELMNMGLCDYKKLNEKCENETVRLGFDDLTQIKELLASSYPEAWLDDELVKLNKNFGIRDQGKLISFAGVHAYSKEYQVAAVAHVTTHPDYRKKGYGEQVVALLSSDLKDEIKYIGLNVKTENFPAINCYRKLGFREFGSFIACMIRDK
jgi:ribosomal protein S18 acetylase RimI-like enzyme